MTIDIVMSHNGTDSLSASRQLDLQFDLSSLVQFDWNDRRHPGFANVLSPSW